MLTKEKILALAKQKHTLVTRDLVRQFNVSRQYASGLIGELVADNKLIKLGSTRKALYVVPEYALKHKELFPFRYSKTLQNKALEEHRVLNHIEQTFTQLRGLPENVRSIFTYAFSEMLNNAIEHSNSSRIIVEVSIENKMLTFTVRDFGIGVFRNIMHKRHLDSELQAIQDLLKGKTTTMPKSHSGEGIFFTSKAGDFFALESFDYGLIQDNTIPDVFVQNPKKIKRGTNVIFKISVSSKLHLNDVFKQYTNISLESDHGFDKTRIQIKLYAMGGVHISRSQARRVLSGLEKFKIIIFDFDKVPVAGQAFADEIFRVFQNKHTGIKLEAVNMNEGVRFMVNRAKAELQK